MMRSALLCLCVVWAASGAEAQSFDRVGEQCTLHDVDGTARSGEPIDPALLASARRASSASRTVTTSGRTATFQVQYNGFTTEAEAAFQAAVDVWSDHIDSDVTIRIEADFSALAEGTLGAAGPLLTAFNTGSSFPGEPLTWYPRALADALVGSDLNPPAAEDDPNTSWDDTFNPDILATFNSDFDDFYFGTDGNPPSGDYDFRTVVLHELGHGLGFVGSGDYDDGADDDECDGVAGHGCWGFDAGTLTLPVIFDTFVEDASGVSMLNETAFPQNSVVLGDLLTSNGQTSNLANKDLFWDGETVREANMGLAGPLYAPNPAEAGSSFSHWDENVYPFAPGDPQSDALMTPGIARTEVYFDPGALTCALFQDIGWTLAPACEALFPVADEGGPEAVGVALVPLGANPFRTSTAFRLVAPEAASVSVRLVDALGRSVAELYDGVVGPGGVRLDVDGRHLAAGVYSVRVLGEGVSQSARVVRTR